MPESPRYVWGLVYFCQGFNVKPKWLAAQGRLKEAECSIARSYGIEAANEHTNHFIQTEVTLIANQVEMEKSLNAGWIACFNPTSKTVYRTLLGMLLQCLQQLTAANYFFYYGATVFQSVGLRDNFIT